MSWFLQPSDHTGPQASRLSETWISFQIIPASLFCSSLFSEASYLFCVCVCVCVCVRARALSHMRACKILYYKVFLNSDI
jgi:hypothetical protein